MTVCQHCHEAKASTKTIDEDGNLIAVCGKCVIDVALDDDVDKIAPSTVAVANGDAEKGKGKDLKGKKGGKDGEKSDEAQGSVGLFALFRYAKPLDVLLIVLGALGAIIRGATYVFMNRTIFPVTFHRDRHTFLLPRRERKTHCFAC